MLQGINQRLKTAESSLGSGGGISGLIPGQPIGVPAPEPQGFSSFEEMMKLRTTQDVPNFYYDLEGVRRDPQGNLFTPKPGQLPTTITRPRPGINNINFLQSPQQDPNIFGYDPSGSASIQDRYSTAQQAAEKARKEGFAKKLKLPGEMSFEDFSDIFGAGGLQPLKSAQGDLGFPTLESIGRPKLNPLPMRGGAEMLSGSGIPAAGYADGGNVVGGEFDFESARQMYGLGKLVKKVTRTVKKIAKSPVGKAALIGGGGYLLGGGIIPGVSGKFLPFAKYGSSAGSGFGFGNILPNILNIAKMPGLAEKAFSMGTAGKALTGIAAASALAGLLTPAQEKQAQELAEEEGIDIEAARNSILARAQGNIPGDLRATAFLAEGGKPEPVAKKTMPLLDMGGKEMDLREEGGFVPIGRMEKADDVPARLSKNEFVFTADAVRNAGDGDVDKGAEVMYNMMKNLEAGGEVSEESQGLEGARKMFQTSQRLEEVL